MSESDWPIEITVQETAAAMRSADPPMLLDVREQDEYDATRIAGSTLIPMSQLGDRLDELSGKQSDRIIVHCHHGGRSMQVTQALRSRGFVAVQNMAGGIDAWSLEIDPEVPRY